MSLRFVLFMLLTILAAFAACACSWEYTRDMIETHPGGRNCILAPGEAVSVSLPANTDMDSAERLFKVSSAEGLFRGRCSRSEETLTFKPEEEYTPGVRYLLSFKGDLLLKSGDVTPVFIELPFFYLEGYKAPLQVTGLNPSPGSFIGREEQFVISLSHKLDAEKLESALSFSPEGLTAAIEMMPSDSAADSAAEYTEYLITPKTPFPDSAVVELIISRELTAEDSLPLAGEYRAAFHVQSDVIPVVLNLFSAENNPAENFPNLFPVNDESPDIEPESVYKILFSTEMDSRSVETALKTDPFIAGSFINTGAEEIVFIPDQELASGNTELTIEASAESSEGVKLKTPFSRSFHVADAHTLTEIGGKPSDGFPLDPAQLTSEIIEITPSMLSGDYTFTFLYSGAIPDTEDKLLLQESVKILSIFPPFNTSPQPIGASWVGGRLSTGFTGFKVSDEEHAYYYRLEALINDGTSGGKAIELFLNTVE